MSWSLQREGEFRSSLSKEKLIVNCMEQHIKLNSFGNLR
jgi:hypothetical protein